MKKNIQIGISGTIRLIGSNYNKDGVLEQVFDRTVNNLITDDGFNLMCDVLGLTSQPSDITHMAIGSGTGQGTGATTLATESQRETTVYAHSAGTKVCTFTTTFTTVVAGTEYGLFNAGSGGDMFNVSSFSAITVDSLQIIATLTLSDVG